MKWAIAGALALLASCKAGPTLQSRLEQATSDFRGIVGVHVRHLETGETADIRADELFPTASLVKVPILIGMFARIEAGELDYRAKLVTEDHHRKKSDSDLVARFEIGSPTNPAELAMLMCSFSDNSASLWCQELAGGGGTINTWLERAGFSSTRVNSRVPGREEDYKQWGWGQTTPREMAELLVRIHERSVLSPGADEEMLRLLSRAYWSGEALSELPPDIHAMSKQGAINRSRSEVLLVNAPHGPYVLCVITKEQQDTTWEHGNEGFVLLRTLSRLVYEHFEPGSGWNRPTGSQRYD